MYTYTSSTRTRRGGSCLKEIYIYIRPFSSIELACAVCQPSPCVHALCESCVVFHMSHLKLHFALRTSHCTLHTPHYTLHTSHFCWLLCAKLLRRCCPRTWPAHDPGAMQRQANTFFTLHTALFTLHTCTSHLHFALDTSSLKSCELFSPHLRSSHLIPSLLTCQLSKFFSTVFTSSEHWSTFLISLEFVSTHLSCSARKKALTVREKSFAQKNIGRRKLLHTDTWDTDAFTYNSLSEILCTTKLAQSTSQYYFVLQSLHKALPSTTLYYKACTKHFPVLLCTTKACTNYFPVLLCTTKQAKSTS